MSEIEKMQSYIDRTPVQNSVNYELCYNQIVALARHNSPFEALMLAYSFGRAKGYRAARKVGVK